MSMTAIILCEWRTMLIVSNLDPRSKLIATLAATVILTASDPWWIQVMAFGILLGMVLILRLGRAWANLQKGLGFAVLTFFIIAWVAFDFMTGLCSGLRLLNIGTAFFLFFQTTSPEDLSNALIKMGIPYSFAFVLTASMQFIPVLARRAACIRDAQRARGIPLDGPLELIRHLPALAGPLLIQAFKLADELAEAMEARGFGSPGRRFRHEPHFRWIDWTVAGISMVALGVFFLAVH
jgi:energy-coupling factor transport system permease protein